MGSKGGIGRPNMLFASKIDDLQLLYQKSYANKAMEIASKNQAIKDAIGEPIVRGPWYNASLAVAQKRNSVSCSFPVSVSCFWASRHRNASVEVSSHWSDWEILIMDALFHIPTDDDNKQRTVRISVSDNISSPNCKECYIKSPESAVSEKANI